MATDTRLERARLALDGLSLGDAFGERFFVHPLQFQSLVEARALPRAPWRYTDDTEMAISVFETLRDLQTIEPNSLAQRFAARYAADNMRGYGGGAHQILQEIGAGIPWEHAAGSVFGGSGSYGNGGAMRVAPVGAYHCEDFDLVVAEATRSAMVTHANPEGIAGAVAIAVATAEAACQRERGEIVPERLFSRVLEHLEPSETRRNVEEASALGLDASVADAAAKLGTGQRVAAQDTVGFSIWCAARHLDDFVEAMWSTVSGMGDRDTTCAIVGGIVAAFVGTEGLPSDWLACREELPV